MANRSAYDKVVHLGGFSNVQKISQKKVSTAGTAKLINVHFKDFVLIQYVGMVSLSETKTITGIKFLGLEKLIEGKIGQVKDTPYKPRVWNFWSCVPAENFYDFAFEGRKCIVKLLVFFQEVTVNLDLKKKYCTQIIDR